MHGLRNRAVSTVLLLLGMLAIGSSTSSYANADESTPRAIPVARAYPRAFSSYEALIAYATTIAADQSALDSSLAGVLAAQRDEGNGVNDVPGAYRRLHTLARAETKALLAGALTSDAMPWRTPSDGRITQPFGPTRLLVEPSRTFAGVSYPHFHDGVDIAGDWAAPVLAPARGRVVFVGRMFDGAEIVVLVHDRGLVSLYAHLDALASRLPVAAGDEVAAGQRIGTVGKTGIVTGIHLHWAVYRGGV